MIINEDGYVKLVDFGISAYLDSTDGVCVMSSGTPQCLAPEIFSQGRKHSYPSDFFSLGLVLYKLLVRARARPPSPLVPAPSLTRRVRFRFLVRSAQANKDLFPGKARDANVVPGAISKLDVSSACEGYLTEQLEFDPEDRPGGDQGSDMWAEVQKQEFFGEVDFSALMARKLKPPFIPDTKVANCDTGQNNFEEQM